ncbi:hypothetical protein SS50377_24481 [Spironucleus salmonicida]|uniref:Uncharacterized protein n=1 Tax=Spironucleus salmonicida TaxID=348837 RepID=V6LYS1_9EUKA|nr:hypothetical protein SS50377_24481 [Spironucleus salmonicida]|eukprot:EST45974.1 Hypothetical protein SS50377_13953 [Spironucleus salmonicida]
MLSKDEKLSFLKLYENLSHEKAVKLLTDDNYQLQLIIHKLQLNYDIGIQEQTDKLLQQCQQPENLYFIKNAQSLMENLGYCDIVGQTLAYYNAGEHELSVQGVKRLMREINNKQFKTKITKQFYQFYVSHHVLQNKIPGSVIKALFLEFIQQEKEFLNYTQKQLNSVKLRMEKLDEYITKYDALQLFDMI